MKICKFCGKETNNNDSLCDNCWEVETRIGMMNEETIIRIMNSSGWKIEKAGKEKRIEIIVDVDDMGWLWLRVPGSNVMERIDISNLPAHDIRRSIWEEWMKIEEIARQSRRRNDLCNI